MRICEKCKVEFDPANSYGDFFLDVPEETEKSFPVVYCFDCASKGVEDLFGGFEDEEE